MLRYFGLLLAGSALVSIISTASGSEVAWPAETLTDAVNLTAIEGPGANDFYVNLSSAFWNPVTRRLWVCRNGGPDGSKFWALREDGNGSFEVDVQGGLRGEWTNFGDLEAVTQADYNEPVLYLMVEDIGHIKECSVSTYGTPVINNDWNVTPFIPSYNGSSGPEGLCYVPDSFLSAAGFVDQTGNLRVSHNGMGGLMFVAHQAGGRIYAFDLNRTNGAFDFVGAYLTNFSESCELTFDRSDGRMYILHGADHNTVEVTNLASTVVGSERQFVELITYGRPSGSPGSWNLEGFALMPNDDCANGQRSAFITIDDGGAGSLYWYKQFPCTCMAGDPNISTQPISASVCSGLTNQFCVTATGAGTLGYQWQKDSVDIPGATSSCYTASQAGDYRCVVSDTCGSVTSNSATLTLLSAPSISSHPASASICSGQTNQFCVTATGSGTLGYQWQKNSVNISGATSSCYTASQAGDYRCVVSNSCGSSNSNAATLTLLTAPSISTHPTAGTVCSGQSLQFCITATGSGSLTYQWQKDTVNIIGATASCYTANIAGSYRCTVTNSCGSATSNSASLTVNSPPSISIQPVGGTSCSGQVSPLCVTASGSETLSYQWKKSGSNVAGATQPCFTPETSGDYSCVVSNSCGSVTSNVVSVIVNEGPLIISQPSSASLCPGESQQLCVSASGSSPTLQWQKDDVDIPGATLSCLDVQTAGTYQCVAIDACGTTTSLSAVIVTVTTRSWYRDEDGDGFGNPNSRIDSCDAPIGYVSDHSDCDDSNPAINPAAAEVCDGIDNNCNGSVDETVDCGGSSSSQQSDQQGDHESKVNDPAQTPPSASLCGTTTPATLAASLMGLLGVRVLPMGLRKRPLRHR